jgi:ribosomal protein L11 methyltransferase
MEYKEITFQIEGCPDDLTAVARDLLMAEAGECGLESFVEEGRTVRGYVQTQLLDETALGQMLDEFPMEGVRITYDIKTVEAQDWNAAWEAEGFEPIVLEDRVAIHDFRHPVEGYPIDIEINARLAFGSGTHETTRMMVGRLMHTPLTGKRVLDCGTGTGILSIAAVRLGASEAVGYDIDEWSVNNALSNADCNRVGRQCNFLLGDASVLETVEGSFDIILANINRNILLADLHLWKQRLAPQGIMMLSGFYRSDVPLLEDKASELGLRVTGQHHDGEWTLIEVKSEE